uniref:Uncharacterized protein n=1 Tax=Coniferiporia sulphurascens TaxID=175648 RepID=A0A5B9RB46_CONSH|nr:hypothetical protein PSUO_000067 [Coniferiporia sulphurascens]QEG57196.1 hypothetical protein PSUO_000067 [Coniferiporia sulphurascens]
MMRKSFNQLLIPTFILKSLTPFKAAVIGIAWGWQVWKFESSCSCHIRRSTNPQSWWICPSCGSLSFIWTKNMKQIIKTIIKNKKIIQKSTTTLVKTIMKLFLINKVVGFFPKWMVAPLTIVIKILFKLSTYATIASVLSTIVSSMLDVNFAFNWAFWSSLLYGIYLIVSEGLWDYIGEYFPKFKSLATKYWNIVSNRMEDAVERAQSIQANNKNNKHRAIRPDWLE